LTERPQEASTLGISDLWAVPALAFQLCSVASPALKPLKFADF